MLFISMALKTWIRYAEQSKVKQHKGKNIQDFSSTDEEDSVDSKG